MTRKGWLTFASSLFLLTLFLALFAFSVWQVRRGVNPDLSSQAMVAEIEKSEGRFEPSLREAFFDNQPVSLPSQELALKTEERVLSAVPLQEKWIEIDLTNQRLQAHEVDLQGNDRVVYDFSISSGKPWTPTVTGEFRVWIKLKYTKMSGGSRTLGNYYYLPNVPYVLFFHQGYGIHGTYWHDNFGYPMSHGCVNMKTPEAEKIFYWADPQIDPQKTVIHADSQNPGTRVVVHGKTPSG